MHDCQMLLALALALCEVFQFMPNWAYRGIQGLLVCSRLTSQYFTEKSGSMSLLNIVTVVLYIYSVLHVSVAC
jgi:hypothetical protein